MNNLGKPIFVFALTVLFLIAIGGGYMMIKFPERFFSATTATKSITEIQDLKEAAAPSPEELTENSMHNTGLFESEQALELLKNHNLEIAFIPSRKTYIEFIIKDPETGEQVGDAQYVHGPQGDIVVVQGGNFEFSEPLFYNQKLSTENTESLSEFIDRVSYRIDLVSDAMDVIKMYAEQEKLSDKILRYVVSDEETGLMHFITDCSRGESCQFELNTQHQMLTIMSP